MIIEKKLEEIVKKQEQQKDEDIGEDIKRKLEAMERDFEGKIKSFQNKIKDLSKEIKDKNIMIKNLETKVTDLETKQFEAISETKVENRTLLEKVEILIEKETFKCTLCAFTTTSKSGLKIHTKRKHTNYGQDVFPRSCELCELKINSSSEMKNHLKTHSCTR